MAFKTPLFSTSVTRSYLESTLTQHDMWIFGCDSITEEEEYVRLPNQNQFVLEKAKRETVFGINVNPETDFSYVIPIVFWAPGIIFDMYDDTKDMSERRFYVISQPETEDDQYAVFKCIMNNYNRPSQIKPTPNDSINQSDGLYRLPDGYIWKFMGYTSNEEFTKFAARGFFPIKESSQVNEIARDGIDVILLENPNINNGYEKLTGRAISVITDDLKYQFEIDQIPSEVPNYYVNQSLYIQKPFGVRVYDIIGSEFLEGNRISLTLSGFEQDGFRPSINDYIEILPKVKISGNGTGAVAIPEFNDTNETITGVRIIRPGEGYSSVNATVVPPVYYDSQLNFPAKLRAITSPVGGHGKNVLEELNCSAVSLSVKINGNFPSVVPNTNTYSKILLVKDPEFEWEDEEEPQSTFDNRLVLELNSGVTSIRSGDKVTQAQGDSNVVHGIVHEVDFENDLIYLVKYTGDFQGTFTDDFPIEINNETMEINSITYSLYQQGTGSVFYVADFIPVERTDSKSEKIRVIITF